MKAHFSFKHLLFLGSAVLYTLQSSAVKNPVDYVSTLVGTQSKFELSTGNTYPATALPWGMNFWTPQTGKWETAGHIRTMPTKSGDSSRRTNPARG